MLVEQNDAWEERMRGSKEEFFCFVEEIYDATVTLERTEQTDDAHIVP